MAAFTMEEILAATGGELLQKGKVNYCTGVSTDTRTISPGEIFVTLIGENFDGHSFLHAAADKGAAALVISKAEAAKDISSDVAVVLVKDTLKALEGLARFHRMRFDIPVVAITGSNGKTTTKDMTAALLTSKYNVCFTQKNFNTEIGLSLTLLTLSEATDVCVVEMGMRGLGQIAELCDIARPTIGVVTNVGTSHLGLLGSQENIAKAKGELIDALPVSGTAILNEDDPFVKAMGDRFAGKVIGFGLNGNYTVTGKDIKYDPDATKFICTCFDEAFKAKLNLLGEHNVYNALAAITVARILGIDVGRIQKALTEFMPTGQRQEIIDISGVLVMDESYNANPLSMEVSFRALKQMNGKRHILVLGDMAELGKTEEKLHCQVGRKAAEIGFDALITVGPLSRFMANGARKGGLSDVTECDSCEEAAKLLAKMTKTGDVVLIKGSHSMHMETIPKLWKDAL